MTIAMLTSRPSGVITSSPNEWPASGSPLGGHSFGLDVITPLGRDVNNAIVIDDPFASADHAVLTYRGRSWYLEDLGSTNGSRVNDVAVTEVVLGVGDRLEVGDTSIIVEVAGGASD